MTEREKVKAILKIAENVSAICIMLVNAYGLEKVIEMVTMADKIIKNKEEMK